MSDLSPSQDIPKLEVYPWTFVGGLTVLWGLLWFFLWATLQGTVASLAVAFGSLQDFRWLPFLIPGLLVLGLGSAAWMAHQLRHDRNPSLLALTLIVLLLTAFAPTAFYMVTMLNRMTPYELTRNSTSVFFQIMLIDKRLDQLALLLCGGLGGGAAWTALRWKYPGIRPSLKPWIPTVWLLALTGGLLIGFISRTVFGILFTAGLGNLFTVYAYRKTIQRRLAAEPPAE
jgi:hypothetical protein